MNLKLKANFLVFLMINSILILLSINVQSEQPVIYQEEVLCDSERNNTWTMGLIYCDNRVNDGYTLFSPMSSDTTYLIDIYGREVNSWESPGGYRPGLSAYLLEDGDVLRTANLGSSAAGSFSAGGIAGRVERISWDGQLEWYWEYSTQDVRSHHDIEPMPNGNILIIAWESKSEPEAIQAGRDPSKMKDSTLWPDHIIEIEPVGTNAANIVWEWHAWDHLIQDYDSTKDNFGVVAEHPELIDINFVDITGPRAGGSDWMHCNGIDYNEILDQIAISCKNMNEIYIIDHSTTIVEASGHTGGNSGKGGDILYRWGNPKSYGAGDSNDQQLFAQHDIQWIEQGRPGEGNLIVYNNGQGRGYSSVDVIDVPLISGNYTLNTGSAWGPESVNWTWDIGTEMYATSISGVERLSNGNTLITYGPKGTFYEVNLEGEIVWKYISPKVSSGELHQGDPIPSGSQENTYKNNVFKIRRYASTFPGLIDKNLTPGDYLENWNDLCPNEESIPWDKDGDGCLDDDDQDGVTNHLDKCEGFNDNIDVDSDEIPDDCDNFLDNDEDGVANHLDQCEGYEDNVDNDTDGIPDSCDLLIDSDEDGIANHLDQCEGYDDSVDNDTDGIVDGCDNIIDSDGDGIEDNLDICEGGNDTIDQDQDGIPDGCDSLIDSDGDGVSDDMDDCPDEYGTADYQRGCLDSDNDGISDNYDDCPGKDDRFDADCVVMLIDDDLYCDGFIPDYDFEGTCEEWENRFSTSSSNFGYPSISIVILILVTSVLGVGVWLKYRSKE